MTYSGYVDKQKRKQYLKEFMRQKRARERQIQKHVNEAITEFLKDSTLIKSCKQLHDVEGNWSEYKNQPITLLIEQLIGFLRNPIMFALRDNPKKTWQIADFLVSVLNTFSRNTLTAKMEAALDISRFISDHAAANNELLVSHVDQQLTEWIKWLMVCVKGGFEGYHNEYEARLKLIDAWRKMWNLEPIKDLNSR